MPVRIWGEGKNGEEILLGFRLRVKICGDKCQLKIELV